MEAALPRKSKADSVLLVFKKFIEWFQEQVRLAQPANAEAEQEKLLQQQLEKYRHLYDYSTEVLQEEAERFNRMDEKGEKFSTNMLLLVGASGFFGIWISQNLLPPQTTLEKWMVVLGILSMATSFGAWLTSAWVIRTRRIERRPLNDDVFQYYERSPLLDVYWHRAKRNLEAFDATARGTDRKIFWLNFSLRLSIAATIFLIGLASLYGWYFYKNPVRFETSQTMSTQEQNSPENEQPAAPAVTPKETPKPQLPMPNKSNSAPENLSCLASESTPEEVAELLKELDKEEN